MVRISSHMGRNASVLSACCSVALAISLAGCSGGESTAPDGTDEGAVRGAVSVPGTAAIQFQLGDKRVVLGAKRKVSEALAAFKKPTSDAVTPRCGFGPATKLTFFNERAEEIASGSYFCFRGSITLKGEREAKPFYFRPGDLDVKDEPLAVADVLWSVDKVEVEQHGEKAELRTAAAIDKIRDAFDVEQEVKPHEGPNQRCAPTHTVTFFHGHDDIAQATYFCGATDGAVKAKFFVPNREGDGEAQLELKGDIEVDATAVETLFQAATNTTR